MRLGVDARMWGPEQTGIGRFIDRLLHHLVQMPHGHELVLFSLEDRAPDLLRRLSLPLRNTSMLRIVPVWDRWYGWGEQTRLLSALNAENLDLLHVPHFNVPLGYRRPFVATIHDVTPHRYPGHNMGRSFIRRLLFRHVFRSTCRRARRLMAVSEATSRDIESFAGGRAVDVVHEGPGIIDTDEFSHPVDTPRNPMASPFLFSLGVWREHKNFDRLIAAFEQLKEKREWRNVLLVIGGPWENGDPSLLERLRTSPVRDDIVTPGFLCADALLPWYVHARAVIVPSLLEGFGFVGLEAMHASTPVVAARAGSLPEIYGAAAHYVDPYDHHSIMRGMDQVMRDGALRSVLVARGKDRVRRYSWRRMTERILSVYEEALGS